VGAAVEHPGVRCAEKRRWVMSIRHYADNV